MKKKKLALLLILVLSIFSAAIALSACSDNEEEPESPLNFVEQSVVGEWLCIEPYYNMSSDTMIYTFNSDGSVNMPSGSVLTFYENEAGTVFSSYGTGHVIKIDTADDWIWYENYPDLLYNYNNSEIYLARIINGRILTKGEQIIIGEWAVDGNTKYTCKADLTYVTADGKTGKFEQVDEDTDSIFGHYRLIEFKNDGERNGYTYRLYDFSNKSLYTGYKPVYTRYGTTRVLHNVERIILGSWLVSGTSSYFYRFDENGEYVRFNPNSSDITASNTYYTFYLSGEGESKVHGHGYSFTLESAATNWIIYDNDRNTAYASFTGAELAVRNL